jgi:hypothetical protein
MAEWIPIAATGGVVLVVQILILIKLGSIRNEQAETARTLNLLMDMVEFQSDSLNKRIAKDDAGESEAPDDRPSIISSYRKPTLSEEPKVKPPPPPPARLKRW